jgi:transposase
MRTKKSKSKQPAERAVKDIRRKTRRQFSAEEKIRIVLEGLRGDDSIAELCRREGIAQSLYYTWSEPKVAVGLRVHGGRQEAACWRHGPICNHGRGEGSAQ